MTTELDHTRNGPASVDTSQHLAAMAPVVGDIDSMPSHAVLARTLLGHGGHAALTTLDDDGFPYPSLAAYSVVDGAVWLCLSELAAHTHNASQRAKSGLLVTSLGDTNADPMNRPRLSMTGALAPAAASDRVVEHHLDIHPEAGDYVALPDFSFWTLTAHTARYIGGFGSMSWLDGAAVFEADIDPVLADSASAVDHMNRDHAEANLAIVRTHAKLAAASSATVTAIDRAGMTFAIETADGPGVARVGFAEPLTDPGEIRAAVVALARSA